MPYDTKYFVKKQLVHKKSVDEMWLVGLSLGKKDKEIIIWNDLYVFKKVRYQYVNKNEWVDRSCEIKIK